MNKKLYILSSVVILLILCLGYMIFINRIDTEYAIDFSNVFSTYDIDNINNYLTDETIIICNNRHAKYAQLRDNVEIACREKRYQFYNSYGHGNNKFKNSLQEITVYLFGKIDDKSIGEVNMFMNLKRNGLFKFEIVSLQCDAPIFEYIFFGKKQ